MAESTPVFRHLIADYLNVGTTEAPDFQVMQTFENIDENPNAQTVEKHYTANKSASTITTGYKTQFPFSTDLYINDAVVYYIRDIAEEQKLGEQTDYIRVRLYEPIADKENTFYARKFRVGFEISSVSGVGGEIAAIAGNLNTLSDVVVGEFNTATRTFTPATTISEEGSRYGEI